MLPSLSPTSLPPPGLFSDSATALGIPPAGAHLQQPIHFAFSFPGANPSSTSLPYSGYPSASGSSSCHSRVRTSTDRDESCSDEMEELEYGDGRRLSPPAGSGEVGISPKRKMRVTLPRGRACLACRNRKLKCTGEKPCATCVKADIDCRYEEIQRRKPRHVLLEERVVELEALMISRGEQPPPSQLTNATPNSAHSVFGPSPTKEDFGDGGPARRPSVRPKVNRKASGLSAGNYCTPPASTPALSQPLPPGEHQGLFIHPITHHTPSNHLALSLHSHRDIAPSSLPTPSFRPASEIQPRSFLELQLITFVLPYTPFLSLPLHPQRFLALLALDTSNPSRPHPALLSILFAEATRILENGTPQPKRQPPPGSVDFGSQMPPPLADADKAYLLSHVRGSSLIYLERARNELDNGIRNVDRPFDLIRAGVAISRFLYSLGRFIEGWALPTARLAVSCGLHRLTGNFTRPLPFPPTGEYPPTEALPLPHATTDFYVHHHALTTPPPQLPRLRMRPVILPPPRDEIELAERVMTFWAAKSQDWAAGVGWGWSVAIEDEECTTEWPWGLGEPEPKPLSQINHRFGIRDLFDVNSSMHMSPFPESTYVLSMKSMCLLSRASHLNDLPESSVPYIHHDGRFVPDHVPPDHKIKACETAITMFRQRLPTEYNYPPPPLASPDTAYDAMADPWYILLHLNLFTAEMLAWREFANYDTSAYHQAIACARSVVRLVASIKPEDWVHVDMMVAVNLSLVARLLYKEADRLHGIGQSAAAKMAADEAEMVHRALATEYARWMPMAGLQALIVARVREGLSEKDGEYERV